MRAKAQQEIITPLLVMGIMIAVVSSVYLWGVPLIQKNQDITSLQKAEDFMRNLNNKIKDVANTESRDKITIEIGTMTFSSKPVSKEFNTGYFMLSVESTGTMYSSGAMIPFVRNETCQRDNSCKLGTHEPELFYVESNEAEKKYFTNYVLTYRNLKNPDSTSGYLINLIGTDRIAGKGHEIIMEYKGTVPGNPTLSNIEIRII